MPLRRSSSFCRILVLSVLLLIAASEGGTAATWQQVGPGGGGRLLATATIPDSPILFSGSDMGSSYRSADGGTTWEMLPWNSFGAINKAGNRGAWGVDVSAPRHIWAGTTMAFLRSFDAGKTWQPVAGPWDKCTRLDWRLPSRGPHVIALSHHREGVILAAFNTYQDAYHRKVFLSHDDGGHWLPVDGIPRNDREDVLCAAFDDLADAPRIVVVTDQAVYETVDDGRTWELRETPFTSIRHVSPGYRQSGETPVLYVNTGVEKAAGGRFTTGSYRSNDGGRTWTPVGEKGLSQCLQTDQAPTFEHITACMGNAERIYMAARIQDSSVSPTVTVFRSDDGGDSWRSVLVQEPDVPGCNIVGDSWTLHQWGLRQRLSGLSVDALDPDRLMVTNSTSCYLSSNGGQSWKPVHAQPMTSGTTPNGGLLVMSAWAYRFDPHVHARHYIPMTDFGGWMSNDSGRTWSRQVEGNRWHQNVYDVAFDSGTPGRMWAAGSSTHDIPFYRYRNAMLKALGGVCRSDNGGLTWQEVGADNGLPCAAITGLCLVAGEKNEPDRLFAAAIGKGLFVSENGGNTWTACNEGIAKDNLAMLRIQQGSDGRLFAISTVRYGSGEPLHPGTLYASDDLGRHWHSLFRRADTPYLLNVALSSSDPNRIAIAALDSELGSNDGGIWLSSDGGRQWKRSITGSFWAIEFSPTMDDRIYAANFGQGLMVSDDRGGSWWHETSLPPWRPTGIFFNPADLDEVYVTAFGGGVWKTSQPQLAREEEHVAAVRNEN